MVTTVPPLIVPVELDTLVVNQGVQNKQAFRQWPFNYKALTHFSSPEPEATQGQGKYTQPDTGIYLHWTLPEALRHGTQDQSQQTTQITYPRVPNRWLVVRFYGPTNKRTSKAWVVESDCPNPDSPSLYLVDAQIIQQWLQSSDQYRRQAAAELDPKSSDPQVVTLGMSFPLAQPWSERAANATFLTAVAPGNVAFSMYQPHNQNIFSFYDALDDTANDTLSYLVVGWYSQLQDDILDAWQQQKQAKDPYGDLLQRLNWNIVGGTETQAVSSLYEGIIFGIPWIQNGDAPATPLADSNNIHVAIGNTTIDAFTALITRQLQDENNVNAAFTALLPAFQYGLLPVIEQVNGDELLRLKIHQAWFAANAGGYRWAIIPQKSNGSAAIDLTEQEAAWLLQLNIDQNALDEALKTLRSLQWDLYGIWWKWQKGLAESVIVPPDDFDPAAYQQAVEHDIPNALTTQLKLVSTLLSKVPQPHYVTGDTAQQAFERGITAFAQQQKLSTDKILKAVAAPRYWQNSDPVFALSGIEPAPLPDPQKTLNCRLASHLITGFKIAGETVDVSHVAGVLPVLADTSVLPAAIVSLVQESFFLDPTNATSIAAVIRLPESQVANVMTMHDAEAYQGVLPAQSLSLWQKQPWTPLYMEWLVNYIHIPYETDGRKNWSFDGKEYHFTGSFPGKETVTQRQVGGRSILSPQAQFTFRARLKEFLDTFVTHVTNPTKSEEELAAIFQQVEIIDQWQFMSQALTGFNDLLALRDVRAQRAPADSIATMVGDQTHVVPYIPNGPHYDFLGVRQGQFDIEELIIYDKFGQVLQVVGGTGTTNPQNYAPVLDASLAIDQPVITQNTFRFAQVAPRLLQPARLDFRLIDNHDDNKIVGLSAQANPISGWILPNHLDNSLLLYAPDGTSLGEFRLLVNDQGGKSAEWQAPPHSSITMTDVITRAPHLANMIQDPAIKQPVAFQAFLQTIDETLWTIDPLGNRDDMNLSILIGRPLALIRARLQFQLDGNPISNLSDWNITYPPPSPEFIHDVFAIRLGDQLTRQDGVIGYFVGNNYATFASVAQPQTTTPQSYVQIIGPVGQKQGGNYLELPCDNSTLYVTILLDPRASMHAITGILPVKVVDVPAQFIEPALSAIEVSFRVGPILTSIQASPVQGTRATSTAHQAIRYPFAAEQNGTWSWWEQANGYDLVQSSVNAQLKDMPNTLREGFLQLIINLNQ
jgi:hypothetical protein